MGRQLLHSIRLGMLVNQAAVAIEHWTGVTPQPEIMRAALQQIYNLPAPAASTRR